MVLIKIALICCFLLVFYQDYKDRQVYWFLFPLIGLFCGVLFYKNTLPELFYNALKLNLAFITVMLLIIALYSKLKLKTSLFKTIGLGDLLLCIALALSFSTIAFIVVFIWALICSLLLHMLLPKHNSNTLVPLAGYMSLFFLAAYIMLWFTQANMLYTL